MADLDLDSLGILDDTDKTSLRWDYLRHYEAAFARFRHQPINIIEIGVFRGASLRLWEKWFSRATIVGIDIRPECTRFARGRRVIAIGSQTDPDFLAATAEQYPPTIVIDDGSHISDHVQVSFEALFPRVLPGGCYVIEDVVVQSQPEYRGTAERATPDYVLALARQAMMRRLEPPPIPALAAAGREIDAVTLIDAAALFWKKPAVDVAAMLAARQALVERSGSATNWQMFSNFILNNSDAFAAAEAAARRAIALRPNDLSAYTQLGFALEKQGDIAGVYAAAKTALELRPSQASLNTRIEQLAARIGSLQN